MPSVTSGSIAPLRGPAGLAAGAGVLILGGLHLFLAMPAYGWFARAAAVVLMIAAARAIQATLTGDRGDIVLVLMLVQTYVFYGVTQFAIDSMTTFAGVYAPERSMVARAMGLVIVSTAILYLGYRVGGATSFRDRCFEGLPQIRRSWVYPTNLIILFAVGVHVLNAVRPDVIPISVRLLTLLSLNVYIALAVRLELELMRGRVGVPISVLTSVAALSFAGLLQGATGSVVIPWAFVMFWNFLRRRRVDWQLVAGVLLLIVLVNPAKNIFRSSQIYLAGGVETAADVRENLVEWRQAFVGAWIGEDVWSQNVRAVASRLSDLVAFTNVVELVPETVTYRGIGHLRTVGLFWIPRLLWPDKPDNMDLLYQEFARVFRYMPEQGTGKTRVGASLLSEAYWSAGFTGVCVFSGIVGFILGAVFSPSFYRSWSAIVISAFAAGHAFLPVQSLTSLLSSILTFLAGTAICILLIAWTSKAFGDAASGVAPTSGSVPASSTTPGHQR